MRGLRSIFPIALLGAALTAAAAPAHADEDDVQFFHNIDAGSDGPVHDAVCFFCNVTTDGSVTGDIVVFFGNVHIQGEAHHDVVNFFGKTTVDDDSTVDGDMVNFFGGVHLGENVTLNKDLVCMFGFLHVPRSVHIHGDRVSISGLVLWIPLLVIFLLVMILRQEACAYRQRRMMAAGYPIPPQR